MAQADYSEIIIAQRRDEEQVDRIAVQLSDIIREFYGERVLLRLQRVIPTVTSLSYLACTNALGTQFDFSVQFCYFFQAFKRLAKSTLGLCKSHQD